MKTGTLRLADSINVEEESDVRAARGKAGVWVSEDEDFDRLLFEFCRELYECNGGVVVPSSSSSSVQYFLNGKTGIVVVANFI